MKLRKSILWISVIMLLAGVGQAVASESAEICGLVPERELSDDKALKTRSVSYLHL